MCRSRRVPLVINDRVDVALAVDADGVHVGQDDIPAAVVRRMIGPDKLLGVSVKTVEQVGCPLLFCVESVLLAALDCSSVVLKREWGSCRGLREQGSCMCGEQANSGRLPRLPALAEPATAAMSIATYDLFNRVGLDLCPLESACLLLKHALPTGWDAWLQQTDYYTYAHNCN